jgi:hypothetical protein
MVTFELRLEKKRMDRGLYRNMAGAVVKVSARDKIAIVILVVLIEVDVRGMK